MKVADVMTRNVRTCTPADTLAAAASLMWNHDCGCVPVVDDCGRPVGMITDRDVCMAAYTQDAPLRAIPVTTAMAHVVYSCAPDDDLHAVEREMGRRQVRRMPVLDRNGQPVGLISLSDIARASQGGASAVAASDVASTLAAVCAPRPIVAAAS